MTNRRKRTNSNKWQRIDLHIHTPASADYREPQVSFLDILTRAQESGLDVIAFTDHNTIAGYRKLQEEIQQLELLKSLNRIDKREQETLAEYERLRRNILLLPGFEFTAAFGFHIIGIFSPEINIRQIEHILLDLNVHAEKLDEGSSTMGATADVLTAYRLITEAGGIAIAAHANSTNGVAMRGFRFGGQTKIAYTQDPNLAALEVTDLNQKGRRTTAAFFSGTKPEYPRRMHVIQGSDAHRLRTDPSNKRNLGIGDRATEILIPELSFDAIRVLFQSNDFARSRPKWSASKDVFDFVQQAREEGPNIVQDFHESMTVRGGRLYAIIANICSFANSNGGTLFVGVHGDPKKVVVGISNPANAMRGLNKEINDRISPALSVQMDIQETKNKKVIRVLVPRGDDPPYAVDDNKIYVRDEAESALAVRDEIVQLVKRGYQQTVLTEKSGAQESEDGKENGVSIHPPRTGVEVVADEEREGTRYFTMRDLRNGNVVKNVTKSSARRLWAYAISQFISLPSDLSTATISWEGELGVLRARKVGNRKKFDLAQKTGEGIKLYFGVTEDGIHGEWRHIVGLQAA